MKSRHIQSNRWLFFVAMAGFLAFENVQAQNFSPKDIAEYRYVERKRIVKKPVTLEKWVEETQYETKLVKEYKPVIETEKREKRTVVSKPVTRTTYKEQRRTVEKPVTETRYRDREIVQTSFEEVTEMREEKYTVETPVRETQFREEQHTVREKITEDLIEVKNQTVYRPKTSNQMGYVPTQVTNFADPNARPRLRYLDPGYYVDPATQQNVWRRGGFHWVQPNTTTTAYVPTNVEQTVLVPETVQTRRPVEVSRYEDRVETRKVPVEVERMVSETRVREVPVTVKKPIVKRSVEKVPYTETRYVVSEEIERIPVEETVYEDIVDVKPYEVETTRWKEMTREVKEPKQVRRKISYQEEREVEEIIIVKVPVDKFGNHLSLGEPVSEEDLEKSYRHVTGYGTTKSIDRYDGKWNNKKETQETSGKANSVLEPSEESPSGPMRSLRDGETGDQKPTLPKNASEFIRNPPVAEADPVLDTDVRKPSTPAISPNHQEDVLELEKGVNQGA